MTTVSPILELKGLAKTYVRPSLKWGDHKEKVEALRGLNLRLEPGETFALLGLNGQGKTTTVRIILGLARADAGQVLLLGQPLTGGEEDCALRARVGYMPENAPFPPYLTVRETLLFYAKLFGFKGSEAGDRVELVLRRVGIRFPERRFRELSKGMGQKAALAQALLNDPDLLILDEPTSGLDPIACLEVREILDEIHQRGKTVLLTSHILPEVERTANRIGILNGGTLVKTMVLPADLEGRPLEEHFLRAVRGEQT